MRSAGGQPVAWLALALLCLAWPPAAGAGPAPSQPATKAAQSDLHERIAGVDHAFALDGGIVEPDFVDGINMHCAAGGGRVASTIGRSHVDRQVQFTLGQLTWREINAPVAIGVHRCRAGHTVPFDHHGRPRRL